MKLVAVCMAILMMSAVPWQQSAGPEEEGLVFGGMRLLPGYKCSPPQPETPYWTVSKKDGVTIRYNGGNVANVVHDVVQDASRDGKLLWTKQQVVDGRTAKVAATKDGRMLIHIAPFNFEAKVETVEQATDVLLMVLTHGTAVEEK